MPSFFSLNEIQFLEENHSDVQVNTNVINKYGPSNSFRYPIDLGTLQYNHYINFQVYVRDKINADYSVATEDGDPVSYLINEQLAKSRGQNLNSNEIRDLTNKFSSSIGGEALSAVNKNANAVPGGRGWRPMNPNQPAGGLTTDQGKGKALLNKAAVEIRDEINTAFRTLKRAKESISLYMPDTLNFDYAHSYNDLSLSQNKVIRGLQTVASGIGSFNNKSIRNLSPFVLEMIDEQFKTDNLFAGAMFGYAINPQFEVIYQSTNLREFRFDFLFYPRSESEAEQVYKIIEAFKFHSSPEIAASTAGRFLVAPSAFDIGFYYNGMENPNIPKIATCVCTGVQVDYAPNGFSAYETNDMIPRVGKTGTPVGIRLQLSFKELSLITKELIRGKVLSDLNVQISKDRNPSQEGSF